VGPATITVWRCCIAEASPVKYPFDRLVPPPVEHIGVVRTVHADMSGHLGIMKTVSLLANSHYWFGLTSDVRKVLRACDVCARSKATFTKEAPELQPLPLCPVFDRVCMDTMGPYPH